LRKRIVTIAVLLTLALVIALLLVMWTGQSSTPPVQEGMYLNDVLPGLRRTYDDVEILPNVFLDPDAKGGRSLASCTKVDSFGGTSTLYLRFDGNDRITHVRTVAQRPPLLDWVAKRFGW
jgi:hypothetical protein